MKILIIRHGMVDHPLNSEGNKLMYPTDVTLNEEGKAQATGLAENLRSRGLKPNRLYTSPYDRAFETANIIAQKLGIPKVIPDYQLRDPDISGWIGMPIKEISSIDIYANPRSDDQETYEHMIRRMEEVFNKLYNENKGTSFGIVSHGDPIYVLMRRLQLPTERVEEVPRLVSRIEGYLGRGEAYCVSINKGRVLENVEHISHDFQYPSPERAR
jgi:broad specificity phosphatase PhoE